MENNTIFAILELMYPWLWLVIVYIDAYNRAAAPVYRGLLGYCLHAGMGYDVKLARSGRQQISFVPMVSRLHKKLILADVMVKSPVPIQQ